MDDLRTHLAEALDFIRSKTTLKPAVGIILGTGLGGLAKEIKKETVIDYGDIPNFPLSTVETHKGKLIFGTLAGKKVVAMQGRFHKYEGYTLQQATFPVRVTEISRSRHAAGFQCSGGIESVVSKRRCDAYVRSY